MAELLAEGVVAAAQLAEASDRMNEKFEKFAEVVATLRFGVSASVTLESETFDGFTHFKELTFTKEDGRWGLYVVSGIEGDEDPTCTSITKCSREMRLRAVEKLPKLLKALVANAKTKTEEVDQASESIDSLTRTATSVANRGRP